MKRTKSIWELHREEQNDALMHMMKMAYHTSRDACPWRWRVWMRFLDFLEWISDKLRRIGL